MCLEPLVCSRCGAPLSVKILKCEYCGTRHMDLSNMSKTMIAGLERESRMLMITEMMESQTKLIIGNIGGNFK